MAKSLNKSRMFHSRIIMLGLLATGVFFTTPWERMMGLREMTDFIGYAFIITCALGRIYASVFIGGQKNDTLITWGPYSLMRNPLYFFSLLGITGIAIMSHSIIATVIAFSTTFFLYRSLIAREEKYLEEKFGNRYLRYKYQTPSLFPSFKNYDCPQKLVFCPQFVQKAVFDAIWWFVPLAIFKGADYLLSMNSIHLPFMY